MAMTRRNNAKEFGFMLGTLEEYVPENHLVRKLEETIDWCFIYPLVSDTIILSFFRMHVKSCFGFHSKKCHYPRPRQKEQNENVTAVRPRAIMTANSPERG